jgi:hypothetical protein
MIKNVESLRPELQFQPFMDRKIPPNRQVHLHGIETPCKVVRGITKTRIYGSKS